MSHSVDADAVTPLLRGRFGQPYIYVAAAESTQRLLDDDAPEGAVAVADHQTAGRGRLGRAWEAPPGSSVLLSIVLRPRVPSEHLSELSLVAGRAVGAAIEEVARVSAEVKWPNDVLVGGRKAAGILAEARDGRVVLGIGVNVLQAQDALPERSEFPATSLRLETGRDVPRAELLAAILAQLEHEYDDWLARYR